MIVDKDTNIYVGNTEITKAYQGDTIIYKKISYTEVEYLESTGTQYIDTLFPATINTKIDIDFQYTNITNSGKTRVFGSRKDWNLNGFYAGTHSNSMGGAYWYLVGDIINDRWHAASKNSDRNKHNLVLSKSGAYLDNTNIWVPDDVVSSFPTFATIALFGAFEGSGGTTYTIQKGIVRIFKCKIYDNDILVRDFIPVLDENNVPCMYDKVNRQFYYNQGENDFIPGPLSGETWYTNSTIYTLTTKISNTAEVKRTDAGWGDTRSYATYTTGSKINMLRMYLAAPGTMTVGVFNTQTKHIRDSELLTLTGSPSDTVMQTFKLSKTYELQDNEIMFSWTSTDTGSFYFWLRGSSPIPVASSYFWSHVREGYAESAVGSVNLFIDFGYKE